jgi:hypothetical protein
MKTKTANIDKPLTLAIERDQLVIRVGIDVLAHAAENCNRFYDDDTNNSPPYILITDKQEFAKDVLRMLQAEDECGSSLISDALDEATVDAFNDGSLGVEYPRKKKDARV